MYALIVIVTVVEISVAIYTLRPRWIVVGGGIERVAEEGTASYEYDDEGGGKGAIGGVGGGLVGVERDGSSSSIVAPSPGGIRGGKKNGLENDIKDNENEEDGSGQKMMKNVPRERQQRQQQQQQHSVAKPMGWPRGGTISLGSAKDAAYDRIEREGRNEVNVMNAHHRPTFPSSVKDELLDIQVFLL